MGQKLSKEQELYQYAVSGNIEATKALCRDGVGLEWKDKQKRTPLITASMDPRLYVMAKTLIELGADVNAYCPGVQGGTPLHHAAKRGLIETVKLLLSHGANACVRNDDRQTPLEVARNNRKDDVVRAIEGQICYFSGYICEIFRPGSSDASVFQMSSIEMSVMLKIFGPGYFDKSDMQMSSRIIWAVVVPCSNPNPPRRPKLELVLYSTPQDAKPHKIIALWNSKLKEPKFNKSDPALIIFDKRSKTLYKFASPVKGEKQQLRQLYNACKGICQVMPSPAMSPATPVLSAPTRAEPLVSPVVVNGYVLPPRSPDIRRQFSPNFNTQPNYIANGANGLAHPTNAANQGQWSPANAHFSPGLSGNRRMDKPLKGVHNGWVATDQRPAPNAWQDTVSQAPASFADRHFSPGIRGNGWMDKPSKEVDNGWVPTEQRPAAPNSWKNTVNQALASPAPSAPPIPEDGDLTHMKM